MSSQTNAITETLRTLHRIHRQLTDLQTRLRRGPQLITAHTNNVQRCKDGLAAAQDEAKKARMASDAKQGQLRDGEEKIKKLQTQLNTANSNREYQSFQEQIAATEMANSVLADEILEGLDSLDGFAEKVTEAETVLKKAEEQAAQTKKNIEADRPVIEGDIARLEAELKETEKGLLGEFKPLYDRAVAARGEQALAPLKGEYCLGCNHKVPLNAINKLLMTEPKPLICQSCGRLLYVPEDWSQG